jgi:diguanylate cyclase (GGDEF) domain
MVGALFCALLGAAGSVSFNSLTYIPLVADWFGEQFSTGVLIVPCILTLSWPRSLPIISLRQLMPLLALIASMVASVVIGGAGSLAFPLPALIWCAIRYSLPATCLLTFITGATEVILVANSIIDIAVTSPLKTPQMFSARLGIATMAVCPVIVSTSVAAINSLMNQVSLRADYDYLTRVYSRSGLYEALQKRPFTTGQHMTVMLLDIDYFKNINDNYGHECGDQVLAAFAREVQEAVGEQSMVARMGGEEFAVVVTTKEPLKGVHLAESVRQRIESTAFHWRNQTLFITVSIGVAKGQINQGQFTSLFNQLLADADEFLYRSKKGGRNRISSRELEQEESVLHTLS